VRIWTACLAALLTAALVPACGGDDPRPGTLTVDERWTTGPFFIEGHASFASIRVPGGRRVADGVENPPHDRPTLVRRLDPGRYRVSGHVQSCAPSCGSDGRDGDPPSLHCSAMVEVDGNTAVTFVRDHAGGGAGSCHVEIEQPPKP
jgi:hypothetical protein